MASLLIKVSLATVCIQSVLYGMVVVLFLVSTYLHLRLVSVTPVSRPGSRALWTPIFIGTIVVFFFITGFWIVMVIQLLQAFATFKGGTASVDVYANPSQPCNVAKTVLSFATIMIADAMVVSCRGQSDVARLCLTITA